MVSEDNEIENLKLTSQQHLGGVTQEGLQYCVSKGWRGQEVYGSKGTPNYRYTIQLLLIVTII